MQVCECMNDSTHVFKGRHSDGVSWPICGGPVFPKPYDERKDSNLPYYRDLKKKSSKRKSTITIDLNFDDKSKLKLRAIAKWLMSWMRLITHGNVTAVQPSSLTSI